MARLTTSIIKNIRTGLFTNTEINSLIDAVKFARTRTHKVAISALAIGDRVSFSSNKTGPRTGAVVKIDIKYVTVKVDGFHALKIPAAMLTKV
jgi:hypothetical protein